MEKLANNRIVDFQYGFRSSQSTAGLLTIVSDRIAKAFKRLWAIWAVALDISKAFESVWHAGPLCKLKSYEVSCLIFGLISFFLSNRPLRMVLDGKFSWEYPVSVGVPQGSNLDPTLFILYINYLPDEVLCNFTIYADDTTLYLKSDQTSDLWQQLELAFELKSDLWDTEDWDRKWFQLVYIGQLISSFDQSNKNGAVEVKWIGLFLGKNNLLQCWGWFSHLHWIGTLTLPLLLKLPPRKLEPLFIPWSFFLLRLLCISINLAYGFAWNTVVIPGQVLPAAIWNCYISYKNRYAGLLVLHLLPLFNPWLIIKMYPTWSFGRCS